MYDKNRNFKIDFEKAGRRDVANAQNDTYKIF